MLFDLINLKIFKRLLSLIFSLLLFAVIPILELLFAELYRNKTICNGSLLKLSDWLFVKGCFTLFSICCLIFSVMSDRQSKMYKVCFPFSFILIFFTQVWLILGSVIFFRDCLNVEDVELNTFMYISIISGYITVLLMLSMENETVDRKKIPILYV